MPSGSSPLRSVTWVPCDDHENTIESSLPAFASATAAFSLAMIAAFVAWASVSSMTSAALKPLRFR